MRSPLLLSIVLATTLGACGQSLTPNKTGTGGVATGTGLSGPGNSGEGGSTGAGGTGGDIVTLDCNQLEEAYQNAIAAAETCTVGAPGQCQQLVGASLSACACPLHVNDTTLLAPIENLWQTTGCASDVQPPCALCAGALDTSCVSVDGGATGTCTWMNTTEGTGGAVGSGGFGGTPDADASLCNSLIGDYATALIAAKSCTAGASDQCAQSVPSSLSPCALCPTYVTDSSALDAIREKWDAAGCGSAPVACPAIACISPGPSTCLASDAGGASCSD